MCGESNVSLSQSLRSTNRVADADPRDRSVESALRIQEDPGTVEPRGLECWQVSGIPAVQGRGPGTQEDEAARQAESCPTSGRAVHGHSTGSGLEYRLRCGPDRKSTRLNSSH